MLELNADIHVRIINKPVFISNGQLMLELKDSIHVRNQLAIICIKRSVDVGIYANIHVRNQLAFVHIKCSIDVGSE